MLNINTNIYSQTAQTNLSSTQNALSQAINRLSSGKRINSAADDAAGEAPSRRRWIVGQARDYVLAHRSRPVGVPELCEQLHVSRRTLQYCFQDVLGMAPATYLRALRLNGARRDLCGRAAGSVQDVAEAWGFWHLSQFATDYRRLFGRRPSETLRDSGMMAGHSTASQSTAR